MANLVGTDLLGGDGAVAGSGLEASGNLQLGLTVVGGLGSCKTSGNHITILVSLAGLTVEQSIAGIVLHIQVLLVLGKHAHGIVELDHGAVGSVLEGYDVGHTRGGSKFVGSLNHVTYFTVLGRNGLNSSIAVQGEGSIVLG